MHGETDPRVTGFVEELRAAFGSAPAPAPSESLATLFAEGLAVAPEPRRRPMVKHGLHAVPGKIAAGLVGLLIGYTGLGAAGALPGPLSLVSDDSEQATTVEEETGTEEGDEDATEEGSTEEGGEEASTDEDSTEEGTEEEEAKQETPTDLANVPVPTSVSEAAHNHAFDEACGNHGAYVSHYARFGTEPECATKAREEAAGGQGGQAGDGGQADATAEADTDDGDKKGKDKAKPAKAKKAKKGKGRR